MKAASSTFLGRVPGATLGACALSVALSTPGCRPAPRAAAPDASTPTRHSPTAPLVPPKPRDPTAEVVGSPRARPTGVVALDVPGFDPAVVSFPTAGGDPSPLVLVAHGAKDLPAGQCELLRGLLGDRGTLVCLAGPRADVKAEPRYFPDHPTLEKILVATLDALRTTYPTLPAATPAIYAGYSQGATMGALMITAHAADFPRLALIEGGFGEWTLASAEEFTRGGGRRVVFVCGTRKCAEQAPGSARILRKAGASTKVFTSLAAGHDYGRALNDPIRKGILWLLDEPLPR